MVYSKLSLLRLSADMITAPVTWIFNVTRVTGKYADDKPENPQSAFDKFQKSFSTSIFMRSPKSIQPTVHIQILHGCQIKTADSYKTSASCQMNFKKVMWSPTPGPRSGTGL